MNFEVKTRASTVLSAVSTEEEIFAVAKDLLGTEIDSVGPHPLRIRLMGKIFQTHSSFSELDLLVYHSNRPYSKCKNVVNGFIHSPLLW